MESTLAPSNLQTLRAVAAVPPDLRVGLLTDPQTSGGLLAGIPAARSAECIRALAQAGVDAAIVGYVEERNGERIRIEEDVPVTSSTEARAYAR